MTLRRLLALVLVLCCTHAGWAQQRYSLVLEGASADRPLHYQDDGLAVDFTLVDDTVYIVACVRGVEMPTTWTLTDRSASVPLQSLSTVVAGAVEAVDNGLLAWPLRRTGRTAEDEEKPRRHRGLIAGSARPFVPLKSSHHARGTTLPASLWAWNWCHAPWVTQTLKARVQCGTSTVTMTTGLRMVPGVSERRREFRLIVAERGITACLGLTMTPQQVRTIPSHRNAAIPLSLAEPWERGPIVDNVAPGSPAERAGLRAGCVVLALHDVPTPTAERLFEIVNSRGPGLARVRFYDPERGVRTTSVLLAPARSH